MNALLCCREEASEGRCGSRAGGQNLNRRMDFKVEVVAAVESGRGRGFLTGGRHLGRIW